MVMQNAEGENKVHYRGVCKTRTGYLRMADADGKMRMEEKMRITKKVRRRKKRNVDGKKNNKIK